MQVAFVGVERAVVCCSPSWIISCNAHAGPAAQDAAHDPDHHCMCQFICKRGIDAAPLLCPLRRTLCTTWTSASRAWAAKSPPERLAGSLRRDP